MDKVITKYFWDFCYIDPNIDGSWYNYKDYVEFCKDCEIDCLSVDEMKYRLLEYSYFESTKRTKSELQFICSTLDHIQDDGEIYTYANPFSLLYDLNDLEIKGKELKKILSKPDIKIRKLDYKTCSIKKNKLSGTASE